MKEVVETKSKEESCQEMLLTVQMHHLIDLLMSVQVDQALIIVLFWINGDGAGCLADSSV